ncbi:MAG: phage holin family protein [Methanosarcinales archaeon]|nr:phage holin family protein [Methanosarcinales archaeon]
MIETKTTETLVAICGFVGIIASAVTEILGGYDVYLEHLILFMILDFLAGLIIALFGKSDKSVSGKISSQAMLEGFGKKILIIFVVVVAEGVDTILSINYLRNLLIYAFIAYESTSIIEHAVAMGLPKSLGKYKEIIENLFEVNSKK